MKVKTFATFREKKLDHLVNEFLKRDDIEILEIQTNTNWLYISATVIYK